MLLTSFSQVEPNYIAVATQQSLLLSLSLGQPRPLFRLAEGPEKGGRGSGRRASLFMARHFSGIRGMKINLLAPSNCFWVFNDGYASIEFLPSFLFSLLISTLSLSCQQYVVHFHSPCRWPLGLFFYDQTHNFVESSSPLSTSLSFYAILLLCLWGTYLLSRHFLNSRRIKRIIK